MLHNLLVNDESSRYRAVEHDGLAVLWRFVKSLDNEGLLTLVGRVVCECCAIAGDADVHKKLMRDGVMRVSVRPRFGPYSAPIRPLFHPRCAAPAGGYRNLDPCIAPCVTPSPSTLSVTPLPHPSPSPRCY